MRILFAVLVVLLLGIQAVVAQEGACLPDTGCLAPVDCPTLVHSTLTDADTVCAGVGVNQACVGHAPAEVTLHGEQEPVLSASGDVISLDTLYSLRLGALLPETGGWGVALLRVAVDEAEHDVFLLLHGETEMRNSCSALMQQTVQTTLETEFRTGPGSQYPSLGTLPPATVLLVNACNCTGNWFRAIGPDEQVGWIWGGSIDGLSDREALPVVQGNTPVYGPMQAFCFRSAESEPPCPEAPDNGLLIQVPPETGQALLRINQIEIGLTSTAFLQSQPDHQFMLNVLDGTASVTLDGFELEVPRGVRAVVPLNADNQPDGPARLELFELADVATVPVDLLPRPIDLSAALPAAEPIVAGVEPCMVTSDQTATQCRVHFVNADADAIQSLDVEFVSAPQGEWSSSVHPDPELLAGELTSGVLAWDATCSVGSTIFIGPVAWRLTLIDEQGHRSAPFEASFNCG